MEDSIMVVALVVAVALLLVIIAFLALRLLKRPSTAQLAEEEVQRVVQALRAESGELQAQALERTTEQVLKLAENRLKTESEKGAEQMNARKQEIDKGLGEIRQELDKVTRFVQDVDKARGESIATLSAHVEQTYKAAQALDVTTTSLSKALAGGQTRGQWGERMAEDVLTVAGFIEGLQYEKQKQTGNGHSVPDFTFKLPQRRVLHMDVKFPLAGYLRYQRADEDGQRQIAIKKFLGDVRQRIKEVTTRDYIDPGAGTLDYVLVFIPNEQVYGFIHEQDPEILDFAIQQKVVLCSPLTLFAILAVIRQSVDNFRLAEEANEILKVLGKFNDKWNKFRDEMGDLGKHLERAHKSYDTLVDTRSRMLDVQLKRVEELRTKTGIAELGPGAESGSEG